MEAASLWAGVRFTARNGSPEALLTDAAGQGLHLYGIFSLPGGFYGHCAAWHYRRLAALARHRRVRLRVEKRHGLYFLLRPLLRRGTADCATPVWMLPIGTAVRCACCPGTGASQAAAAGSAAQASAHRIHRLHPHRSRRLPWGLRATPPSRWRRHVGTCQQSARTYPHSQNGSSYQAGVGRLGRCTGTQTNY